MSNEYIIPVAREYIEALEMPRPETFLKISIYAGKSASMSPAPPRAILK